MQGEKIASQATFFYCRLFAEKLFEVVWEREALQGS
jgi:hypothetical protein